MRINEITHDDYYILCICEGNAEEYIMNKLLDNDKLFFRRKHLIDGKLVRRSSVTRIQDEYLNLKYNKPLYILRIIDSKSEKFILGKAYRERYEKRIINVITSPEIEMLIIIKYGDYDDYTKNHKSKMKPSSFCSQKYKIKGIKRKGALDDIFSDVQQLLDAIYKYAKQSKNKGFYMLRDLLKE